MGFRTEQEYRADGRSSGLRREEDSRLDALEAALRKQDGQLGDIEASAVVQSRIAGLEKILKEQSERIEELEALLTGGAASEGGIIGSGGAASEGNVASENSNETMDPKEDSAETTIESETAPPDEKQEETAGNEAGTATAESGGEPLTEEAEAEPTTQDVTPAAAVPTESETVAPAPAPFSWTSLPWEVEYKRIYDTEMAKSPEERKFVVFQYRPGDAGWGNRIMGMITAAQYALITQRMLVIDHPLYTLAFELPPGDPVDWRLTTHAPAIAAAASKGGNMVLDVLARTKDLVASSDWNKLFPARVLRINWKAFNHDEELIGSRLDDLFQCQNATYRQGQIGSRLMRQPTSAMLQLVEQARQQMGLAPTGGQSSAPAPAPARPLVSVQFRTMKDYAAGHAIAMQPARLQEFWSCVHTLMAGDGVATVTDAESASGGGVDVLFTTDEDSIWGQGRSELGRYGHVAILEHPFEHSSRVGQNSLPSSLAEWYLMGDSQPSICTGTSFCSSALARTGFRTHELLVFGIYKPVDIYCGAMVDMPPPV